MRKVKAALMSVAVCLLVLVPIGPANAGGCPDPENPCDPQPYHWKEVVCWVLPTC